MNPIIRRLLYKYVYEKNLNIPLFLKDVQICKRIADAILINEPEQNVLEIGPGTGALTQFLIPKKFSLVAYEVDIESIEYLSLHYPDLKLKQKDILSENWGSVFEGQFTIVGNFPYNISSQILVKFLNLLCLLVFFKDNLKKIFVL